MKAKGSLKAMTGAESALVKTDELTATMTIAEIFQFLI